MHTVTVELDQDVFGILQSQARPFVDTPSSVIRRMWEDLQSRPLPGKSPAVSSTTVLVQSTGVYTTNRGVKIPFGELRAMYKRRGSADIEVFKATVTAKGIEFKGRVFGDPSPAGIYAKNLSGVTGSATSTNGWEFWEYYDVQQNQWFQIGSLRNPKP